LLAQLIPDQKLATLAPIKDKYGAVAFKTVILNYLKQQLQANKISSDQICSQLKTAADKLKREVRSHLALTQQTIPTTPVKSGRPHGQYAQLKNFRFVYELLLTNQVLKLLDSSLRQKQYQLWRKRLIQGSANLEQVLQYLSLSMEGSAEEIMAELKQTTMQTLIKILAESIKDTRTIFGMLSNSSSRKVSK
jgi:hypothetical protein